MLKALKRFLRRVAWLSAALLAVLALWLFGYGSCERTIATPLQFTLKQGSSLRSAARQMRDAGVISSPFHFEVLGRLSGHAARIQAGNYEVRDAVSPFKLLEMITSGVRGQDQLAVIDGWTFSQLRAALDQHPALKHDTAGIAEPELAARLGIAQPSA